MSVCIKEVSISLYAHGVSKNHKLFRAYYDGTLLSFFQILAIFLVLEDVPNA